DYYCCSYRSGSSFDVLF
nr:immunoglobulin light chain junction region [Macaca mulatta]